MVIPFDDHMVHRGHGIFDTAGLVDGKIYDLEAHLDRFLRSAERSKLRLPGSRDEMRDIIVTTTAASGQRDGSIRYWLSSGPGSLELSPAAGAEPGFFVMIFGGLSYPERWYTEGLRVMTTTYPIKPPLYAITKATNYLPNVLMQMEAKEAGFDNGVFIDADGHVGESSNMNVAFVTRDGVLAPPEVRSHPARAARRCGCWSSLERCGIRALLTGVEVCDIPVAEARAAREMLLLGSSIKVAPIVQWDGQPIGDGKPGPVARALLELLEEDMRNERSTDRRALLSVTTHRASACRPEARPVHITSSGTPSRSASVATRSQTNGASSARPMVSHPSESMKKIRPNATVRTATLTKWTGWNPPPGEDVEGHGGEERRQPNEQEHQWQPERHARDCGKRQRNSRGQDQPLVYLRRFSVGDRSAKEPGEQHHVHQGKQDEPGCAVERPLSRAHMEHGRGNADGQSNGEHEGPVHNPDVPNATVGTYASHGYQRHLHQQECHPPDEDHSMQVNDPGTGHAAAQGRPNSWARIHEGPWRSGSA